MAWSKLKTASAVGITVLFGTGVLTVATHHPAPPTKPLNAGGAVLPAVTSGARATPKGTLRYLAEMLESGEGRKVAEAVQLGAEKNPRAEDAVEKLVIGQARFKRALIARFGAGEVTQALEKWRLLQVPSEGLDEAVEQVEGDWATVQLPGRAPLRFAKMDGNWRLVLPGADAPQTIAQFVQVGGLLVAAAAELDARKYRSAEETFRSLQARLASVR